MKNFFAMILVVTVMLTCSQVDAAKKITAKDTDFAFQTITQKLRWWNCTPINIRWSGVDLENIENVKYMNELAKGKGFNEKFTACMVFYSDFISPPNPNDGKVTAWNYDKEYKNYSWYFGLYDDGEWKLLTFGY